MRRKTRKEPAGKIEKELSHRRRRGTHSKGLVKTLGTGVKRIAIKLRRGPFGGGPIKRKRKK